MKNTVTEVKNAFWLISRLDWAKEAVSELADIDKETSQTEKQREEKNGKYQNRISKYCQLQKI